MGLDIPWVKELFRIEMGSTRDVNVAIGHLIILKTSVFTKIVKTTRSPWITTRSCFMIRGGFRETLKRLLTSERIGLCKSLAGVTSLTLTYYN